VSDGCEDNTARSESTADGPTAGPFLLAASLSGQADAAWARAAAPSVDGAILGGLALDAATRTAAADLVSRGREEFLPEDPIAWIDDQLRAVAGAPLRTGVNVRSTTPARIREAAAVCVRHDAVCEINAHCRQPELRAAGCGETLLAEPARLASLVAAAAATGVTTSVKVRAEVPGVDLAAVADRVADAGGDWLHVDTMDSEPIVATIDTEGLRIVANNGVRGRQTVAEYARYGADAVSVGRPSTDPVVLSRVATAVADWRAGRLNERRVDRRDRLTRSEVP
jgi:TIM-barrel protein